jgi:hypothetical protein
MGAMRAEFGLGVFTVDIISRLNSSQMDKTPSC